MKKKILVILLALAIMLPACGKAGETELSGGSGKQTDESSDESSYSAESSAEVIDMSEEVSEPEEINRTWPCVSGTFMQPGAFLSYTVDNWKTHFKYLKEVGIDIFIIQWTAETPYGKFKSIYYPSSLTEGNEASGFSDGSTLLPRVLEAAEEMGIKVFVGLNLSDEWWSFACTKDDWNKSQSDIGVNMAKEIYDLYKKDYPDALYGWYFAWEMYNGMSGYETKTGSFLNMYLDPLTEIDPSMPMMLSPFVRSAGGTAQKACEEWKKVFATANFRDGDIFCCQDAVGAGHITIDQLDGYFAALKEAVDTEKGLLFWANDEDFTKDYQSAYVSRFIRQMQIASSYVSGYVTFAYSHYYAKDYNGKGGFHRAYKYYYDTGTTEVTLEKPVLTYSIEDGSANLKIYCLNNEAGIQKVICSSSGRSDYIKEIPVTQLDNADFTYHYSITPKDGETSVSATVSVYDYYGNVSSETIEISFS